MRLTPHGTYSASSWPVALLSFAFRGIRLPALVFAAIAFAACALPAQSPNLITQAVDPARVHVLVNHHPLWATADNSTGMVPANQAMDAMTLVLARSPERQMAFEQFLADQQNPASPEFHHWLTPEEVGERFGLSDEDIATVTGGGWEREPSSLRAGGRR